MMLEVTATQLDQITWYRRLEDMTLDELVHRLTGASKPNRAMELGTAWHSVLEDPPESLSAIQRDGFNFVVECEAEITLPQVREIRAAKMYRVDGVAVLLSGGCDGISGNVVTDHKLTARPDPEKYLDSYQWRAYLDIFGADVFEYILYHAKDEGDVVRIRDVSPFRFYRYPQMFDDLIGGLREYVAFCREHIPAKLKDAA